MWPDHVLPSIVALNVVWLVAASVVMLMGHSDHKAVMTEDLALVGELRGLHSDIVAILIQERHLTRELAELIMELRRMAREREDRSTP